MPNTKSTSNKEHIGNDTASKLGHEPITAADGRLDMTKSGKAYQIFDEMHKNDQNVARKDCLERAVNEADMTPASAATFYQNWRKDNGMVHSDDSDGRSQNFGGNNGASTQPVEIKGSTQKNSGGSSERGTATASAGRSSPAKGPTNGKTSKGNAASKK